MTMATSIPWSIFRYVKADTAPTLTVPGETVIWERTGAGIYDDYNSSLDAGLWDKTEIQATVSEGASTINVNVDIGPGAGAFDGSVETNNLPALSLMSEVEFRVVYVSRESGLAALCKLIIFGNTYNQASTPSIALNNDDSVWRIAKKENGDWNVYDDEVLLDTLTPTDNIIKVEQSGNNGGNDWDTDIDLYEITVDGGMYMLIRSTTKTLQLPLDPLQ